MLLMRRLMKNKGAIISLIVIATYIIVGAFAPIFAPHNPTDVNVHEKFAGISLTHLLGTDHLGRDILSRLIFAIRPSVIFVIFTLLVSVFIGMVVGFIAGYFRGWVDYIIMRICDIMLAFPSYVMTLALIALLGVGLDTIIIAFILTRWAWFCRVIRTSVMQYSDADHVKFARTIGLSHFTIIKKHVLPLTMTDIAVIGSSSMCSMILQISGFSFLGLGVKAPTAEFGMMMNEARKVMFTHPEMMFAPGIAIVVIVLAFNFLSDALQVTIDPRLAEERKPWFKKRGAVK